MLTCDSRTFVNADKAANLQATYQVHLRGGGRINWIFDNGSLTLEEPSTRPVDCHISADPAAFFMVFWERQSHRASGTPLPRVNCWRGAASLLGLKFRSLIRNP